MPLRLLLPLLILFVALGCADEEGIDLGTDSFSSPLKVGSPAVASTRRGATGGDLYCTQPSGEPLRLTESTAEEALFVP